MARAPIAVLLMLSVFVAHVAPPSLVFQTPPPAVPAYGVLLFVRSVASDVTRPLTMPPFVGGSALPRGGGRGRGAARRRPAGLEGRPRRVQEGEPRPRSDGHGAARRADAPDGVLRRAPHDRDARPAIGQGAGPAGLGPDVVA